MGIHNLLSELFKTRCFPSCLSSVTALLFLCYKMFSKSNLRENFLKWYDCLKKTCDFYFANCISLGTAWISWVGLGFCSILGQKSMAPDPMNGNCCKTLLQPQLSSVQFIPVTQSCLETGCWAACLTQTAWDCVLGHPAAECFPLLPKTKTYF